MCSFSKYEKEAEGAATYAHEILHLFGARDLYMTSITDGISSALVRHVGKKYPNDIMFSTFTKSGKTLKYKIVNQVDRVTAYYLGWKTKIPEKQRGLLCLAEIPKGALPMEQAGERTWKNGIGNEQTSISAAFEKGF